VLILTLNEEKNLPACLETVSGWVEQVIVVDSGSTDSTESIARMAGASVVSHPFENYGAQRNWALDSLPITTPWVLNIDADERVTTELRDSVRRVLSTDDAGIHGYLVSRRTMFMGRWMRHGGHYPAWHLRLFRTGRGRCEDRLYDQHFVVDGAVQKLAGDLIDVLTTNLVTFSQRHVRWAALEATEQEVAAEGAGRLRGKLTSGNPILVRRRFREAYDRMPILVRPVLYFLYRYVVRWGFLDGREGLVFHVLQGFWYRFLVDAMILENRLRLSRLPETRNEETR
jgi:glycosyltransferase involved in cell wall biosynthesis